MSNFAPYNSSYSLSQTYSEDFTNTKLSNEEQLQNLCNSLNYTCISNDQIEGFSQPTSVPTPPPEFTYSDDKLLPEEGEEYDSEGSTEGESDFESDDESLLEDGVEYESEGSTEGASDFESDDESDSKSDDESEEATEGA